MFSRLCFFLAEIEGKGREGKGREVSGMVRGDSWKDADGVCRRVTSGWRWDSYKLLSLPELAGESRNVYVAGVRFLIGCSQSHNKLPRGHKERNRIPLPTRGINKVLQVTGLLSCRLHLFLCHWH